MEHSKLSCAIYWIVILFNIGVILVGLWIIIPEIAEVFNYRGFRRYSIGWGYGLGVVYIFVSLIVSLLSLLFLKGHYFKRVAIFCLISNFLCAIGHCLAYDLLPFF